MRRSPPHRLTVGPHKGAVLLILSVAVVLVGTLVVGAIVLTGIHNVSMAPSPNDTSGGNPTSGAPTTAAAAQTTCVPQWDVVPGPDQGQSSVLYSVSAVSANDVWAVGEY